MDASYRQPAMIAVQAFDPFSDAMLKVEVDLLEGGRSILGGLTVERRPAGAVEHMAYSPGKRSWWRSEPAAT